MSKKGFEKFVKSILTLDLEHDIHRFMITDLHRMAAKCGMYEDWEQTKAILAAVNLGVLKQDGAFYVTNLKVTEAIEMYKQFGGEFIEAQTALQDEKK